MGFVEGSHFLSGGSLGVPFFYQGVALRLFLAPFEKEGEKLWMAVPLCLLWRILQERNRLVFEDTEFSLSRIRASFISSLHGFGVFTWGIALLLASYCVSFNFFSWVVRLTAFICTGQALLGLSLVYLGLHWLPIFLCSYISSVSICS